MPLTFRPLHPIFAAEVSPVDLRTVNDRETLSQIRAGMDEYAVLVFREQSLTIQDEASGSIVATTRFSFCPWL